ncbi:MAG: DUF3267 domain-containing protein [Bergeyella zoohelcum]|nr:DUF3267 domain-containing protein [Bergeyella zoohelcum]
MENLDQYTKEKVTIDILKANVFSIVVAFLAIFIFAVPFFIIWGFDSKMIIIRNIFQSTPLVLIAMMFSVILGIILHEIIHGIFFVIFAKNGFSSIKFGVLWEMLTPYCHCKEPLKIKQYIIGVIMPSIILGFIPAVLSLFFGSIYLLFFGIFFIMVAAGDFMIILSLRKYHKEDFVQDHPSEVGCWVFINNNKS